MSQSISMSILNKKDAAWCIDCAGYFKENIAVQLLNDDIPQEAVDNIFNNAANILSQCPNPQDTAPNAETGVVIGKVQSGKTSNFIALTALSFDNGYGVNIVLGGSKKNLLAQNVQRIEGYYNSVGTDVLPILNTQQNTSLLNAQTIRNFLSEGRKVIIVGLKHPQHINKIAEIFDDAVLRDIPTLIIDDEGDQATLNTKAYEKLMSSTYGAVIKLKEKLKRHCFVSITATPQANILIETWDKLSPDFGHLVYPGEEYCGLHEFHGENQDTLVRIISEDEPNLLDEEGVPDSFYDSLAAFFVGGALRKYRGDGKNHSMLIHPSQKKFDHKRVIDKVTCVVCDWQEKAKEIADGIIDISFEPFNNLLKKSYDHFVTDGVAMPEYNELYPYVIDCVKKCAPPHLCNSDEDASNNAKYYPYNIFVGGNMVERGITIKGLAVTYIMRRAKGKANVDNTEQRARWFGYKKSYLDVCRVYTTQTIKEDFSAIYEHEDDLWDSIERAQAKGISFKEIPRIFILASKRLNLTRKNVAEAERLNFSEWSKQDYLLADSVAVQRTIDKISTFRTAYEDALELRSYNGVNQHKMVRGLNYFELCDGLLSNLEFPVNSHVDTAMFRKIGEVLKKANITPEIDIMWIRDGEGEQRTLRADGQINQLFQGHNPNKASTTYYPGDGAMILPDRGHVMQLQIHMVKARNKPEMAFYAPALALYIPIEYAEQMDRIIGRL
ncbi:MAG: Z1 domain-containing protein [Oscillospiraceae bacterium]|jgi:hypothetical protein|nr:Z1 domain-containing protein [Oscillospiraceae bacterium]